MQPDKDFPSRLKERRIELKWSKAQLARVSGVAQQQIYRYEDGISVPRDDIIAKLAGALQVELLWLIKGLGPKFVNDAPYESLDIPHPRVAFPLGDETLNISLPSWLIRLLQEAAEARNNDLNKEILDRILRSFGYALLPSSMTPEEFDKTVEELERLLKKPK